MGFLEGKMWAYSWGTRRELLDVYRYLKEFYPLTGVVYGRKGMFGVREDKSLPHKVWLWEVKDD